MKGSKYYEDLAVRILEQKGFKDIKVLGKPYDIEAEKDCLKYAIEVKGSDISFTTSWSQVRQMYFDHFLLKDHRVLLMFVTERGHYCIFQMTDAMIV
jgi:predicted RecB family endonuclease